MSGDRGRLVAVVERELVTVARTRMFLLLAAGFVAVVLGVAWAGGGVRGGYVTATLDFLTPLEVLVPLLAFAVGYRSILGDAESGELEMIRTYPVSRGAFALGVFVGRATALLLVLVAAMVLAGVAVPLSAGPGTDVVASHGGADSVVLYLRFVVLTAVFALVTLAVALAVSVVSRSPRQALALAVAVFLALVLGLDLGLVAALAGGVLPPGMLDLALALSPNSAYRSLVLSQVVGTVGTGADAGAPPLASALGLLAWAAAAGAVVVRYVWRT